MVKRRQERLTEAQRKEQESSTQASKGKAKKRPPLKKRRAAKRKKVALSDSSKSDGESEEENAVEETNPEIEKLRKENEELKEALRKAIINITSKGPDVESIPSRASFDSSVEDKATTTPKVLNLNASESGSSNLKAAGQVKPHKVKKLKDLTDVPAMKDFLHDVERLSLLDQVTAYLDRSIMEKLGSIEIKTNQEILDYISQQVKSCEESEDVEGKERDAKVTPSESET